MTSTRADIRDEILGRLDSFGRDVIAMIRDQIPAYAALSADQVAEVTAIAAWGTTRILQEWADGGALSEADVRRFKGIGAARALDGRPLPGVLRAYRLAGSLITELVEEVGGPRLTVTDAMDLSRLSKATSATWTEALYAGHTAATDRVSGDRGRTIDDLVDDLMIGRQVTRIGLADRCRELGLTLASRLDLLVLTAGSGGEPITRETMGACLAQQVLEPSGGWLVRVRAGVAVAILPSGAVRDQDAVRQRRWRGCLLTDLLVADLPRAHRLTEHALDRAPERAFADRDVLDEADLQVLALLAGHGDADVGRLDTLLAAAWRGSGADHLGQGLQAYLDTGSAAEAADLLGLHAQTMRYRLRRIADITGRDPRRPWDRLVLEAALMATAGTRRPEATTGGA